MARSLLWLEDVPLSRRHLYMWLSPDSFRPMTVGSLTAYFKSLVADSRLHLGIVGPVHIGPHQMRKFAASYASLVGQDEEYVWRVMGFSSLKIFRKNYVSPVPPLVVPCVLPGGPYLARRDHSMSDSECE